MISVILPVFNEERVLEKTVRNIREQFESLGVGSEIIITEDGSTDRTPQIAEKLSEQGIKLVRNGKRMGKGAAIKNATRSVDGDIILVIDADIRLKAQQITEIMDRMDSGADVVIASRYLKGSRTSRDFVRYVASKGFNFLVRLLLGSKISDHQCGFKAFKKESTFGIFNQLENKKWFWDTEFLVRAQRKGLMIVEVPIEWKESKDSKLNVFRDGFWMGINLAKFKIKHW